jgi:predicted extracellular nuclease
MHLGHRTFESTGAFCGGHLRIASTNVENLGGNGEFHSFISCKNFM